jgi:hypothetical protein
LAVVSSSMESLMLEWVEFGWLRKSWKAEMSCGQIVNVIHISMPAFHLYQTCKNGFFLESCHKYCHVLSDYRRVLDWQLHLLGHSVHFTIHYSVLHCLPSRPILFSAGPRTSCRPNSQPSTLHSVLNSYGIFCHHLLLSRALLRDI